MFSINDLNFKVTNDGQNINLNIDLEGMPTRSIWMTETQFMELVKYFEDQLKNFRHNKYRGKSNGNP